MLLVLGDGTWRISGTLKISSLVHHWHALHSIEAENWPDEEEATKEDVEATLRRLNEALAKERTRQWSEIKEPEISNDPQAARLQKAGLDLPKTVAERAVKEHRHRQFLDTPPKTDKVQ